MQVATVEIPETTTPPLFEPASPEAIERIVLDAEIRECLELIPRLMVLEPRLGSELGGKLHDRLKRLQRMSRDAEPSGSSGSSGTGEG